MAQLSKSRASRARCKRSCLEDNKLANWKRVPRKESGPVQARLIKAGYKIPKRMNPEYGENGVGEVRRRDLEVSTQVSGKKGISCFGSLEPSHCNKEGKHKESG